MLSIKSIVVTALNTFKDNGWHPALRDCVRDLTAAQAEWRPAPGEHCIWNHVNHITTWTAEEASRLAGNPPRADLDQSPEAGWPGPAGTGDDRDWQRAVARLEEAHARLVTLVEGMDEAALASAGSAGETPPASGIVSFVNHYSYHGSQIVLLRRLQGIWQPGV